MNVDRNTDGHNRISVRIVSTPQELMHVIAVRSICFMEEMGRTIKQAYDGNDYQCTHIIAYYDEEPIACVRIRWFRDFAKLEKTALRASFRQTRALAMLGQFTFEHVAMKGYDTVTTTARPQLARLWRKMFGFVENTAKEAVELEGHEDLYVELIKRLSVPEAAITASSPTKVLLRVEGQWGVPSAFEGTP